MGFYIADSKPLAVCDNHRIRSKKVFDGVAARGKSSMGLFYGLKAHLIINHTATTWPSRRATYLTTMQGC